MVYTEIEECHWIGRPILVGTGTVDESEFLAKQLADRGIPHEVLNARPQYEEQEAGIIAQAGSPGAVTISTNMAGRVRSPCTAFYFLLHLRPRLYVA